MILVPKLVDLSVARCPEVTDAERERATAWVKRLTPAENTRRGVKDKLDEHAVGQVKDKAIIASLISDKQACRGEAPKAAS